MTKPLTDRVWIGLLGLFTLGALLSLSLAFWKERILFTDMAFHTFVIIQTKALAIQNYRFGAAFTQVFPLVAAKLQLPLPVLMKIYSASFYVWYSVIFLFILFALRIKEMALVLLMYLTLLVSYSFFWAQSEYPQGMVFLALFFAALLRFTSHENSSVPGYILVTALLITTLFFHPLIAFPFGCCMVYLFWDKKLSFKQFTAFALAGVIILGLKTILLPTGYESGKMGGLKNFITLFPNYLTIPSVKFFVKNLFTDYLGYSLVILSVCAVFIKKRCYLKLGWFITSLASYTLLIHVSYPNEQQSTYMQNMLLPLGFIAAMPFVFEVLPLLKAKIWVPAMLVLISFRLIMIYQSHTFFTERVACLQEMLTHTKKYSSNRFYVASEDLPTKKLADSWALAYETLLLSSIPSPDSARTIESEEVINIHSYLLDSNFVFINRYWGWDANTLPLHYFNLKKGKYQKYTP